MQGHGTDFELLKTYRLCVALRPGHPLPRLKTIPLAKVADESLVTLQRSEYPEYHAKFVADVRQLPEVPTYDNHLKFSG